MTRFEKVAVLGYGTMGRGIVQVMAASGRQVRVLESDASRLDEGHAAIEAFLAESVRRDKASDAEKNATMARIHGTTILDDISDADLVVESIIEDRDTKSALLQQVAGVVSRSTVIATNTSALSVTDLAALIQSPDRFAGMHFFNPAPLMPLVEVIPALQSRPEVVEELQLLCEHLGKTPVVVDDRPGFLINRLLMPYLNDVIQAYDDDLASAADIDTAIELGLGHPIGPFKMLDMTGLDVHRDATSSAYEQLRDPQFAPPPLLERMVSAGYLGEKTGRGFRSEDLNKDNTTP
jgi:3-hydroxybutyryl-CoA dehydrogenase